MRYIQDWEKCINCRQPGREGKIRHLRGCPDFVKPKPTATSVTVGDLLRKR